MFRIQPLQLHPSPLALGAILAVTVLPTGLHAPHGWSPKLGIADFIGNLLLFAPLGWALADRSAIRIALTAAGFSVSIEVAQLFMIDRFTSPFDILANTLGAAIAGYLGRTFSSTTPATIRKQVRIDARIALVLLSVAMCLLGLRLGPRTTSAIAGWDASYPLQIGNETTGDRPWRGVISRLAIAASDDNHGDRLLELSQPVQVTGGASIILAQDLARDLARRAMEANALSIAVSIRPKNVQQRGPARIVSFSADAYHRNFDLGQEGETVVFRVRTPAAGPNGNDYATYSLPVLKAGNEASLFAVYDGAVARIYADGELVGRSNHAAARCTVEALCDGAEPALFAYVGATAAILLLAVLGSCGRLAALASLGAMAAVLTMMGLTLRSDEAARALPYSPFAVLLGAGCVALAWMMRNNRTSDRGRTS